MYVCMYVLLSMMCSSYMRNMPVHYIIVILHSNNLVYYIVTGKDCHRCSIVQHIMTTVTYLP